MPTRQHEIPQRIRAYAETVVDAVGVAHRPYFNRIQTGVITRQKWSEEHGRMINESEPVYVFSYVPNCDRTLPPGMNLSAGWAHYQGYAGCPACWPESE